MAPPPAALDELIAQAGWVRRLAHRLARNSVEGDEIAQRTMFIALTRWQGGDALRPWLRGILRRTARHEVRGRARRRQREQAASRPEAMDHDAAELCAQLEEQQRLASLVRALPEPYRSAILRRYYRGESVADIAQATGHSAATVRSQLSRGHARLREALGAQARAEGRDVRNLLALAGALPVSSGASSTVASAPLTLLAMKTSTQIAALVGLALLSAVALRSLGASDAPAAANVSVMEARGESLAPPLAEEDEDGDLERSLPGAAERSSIASLGAEEPAVKADSEPASHPTLLRLIAVDELDAPLAGARLTSLNRWDGLPLGPVSAPSDDDGRIEIEINPARIQAFLNGYLRLHFALEASYRVTAFLPVAPTPGTTVDLGRVELLPGGALSGRVVDGAGMPVAKAEVLALGAVIAKSMDDLRLQGPERGRPLPRTETDDQGRFELGGLLPGSLRLAAHAEGQQWTVSGLLPVEARRTQGGIELALEEFPSERMLQGLVLDPAGNPFPKARVNYSHSQIRGGELVAGGDGRFSIVVPQSSSVTLLARDGEGVWGRSVPAEWKLGDAEISLQLRDPARVSVMVTEAGGGPVPGAAVMVKGVVHEYLGSRWERTDDDGRLALATLGASMLITVGSKAHEYQTLGPFEPGLVPDPLAVELVRKSSVAGVVTASGVPVAGAMVELCRDCKTISPNFVPVGAGFPMRLFGLGQRQATTGPDGRFELLVDADQGPFVLLASANGYATAEVSVEHEAGTEFPEQRLELSGGGALEGRLRTSDGAEHAGVVVAISRGDGQPLSTRTNAGGYYRFEHLTPGSWRVETRDAEPSFEVVSTSQLGADAFRWDCEVLEGETTVFDLDDRQLGAIVFSGQLRLGGEPAAGWSARVTLPSHQVPDFPLPAVLLDEEGRFAFEVQAGAYELEIRSPDGDPAEFTVHRRFEGEGGPLHWEEDVAVASATGEVADGSAKLSLFRGSTGQGNWERVVFEAQAGVEFTVARVPAGECFFQRETQSTYGLGWTLIDKVSTTSGQQLRLP